jgi:carbon starvation protein
VFPFLFITIACGAVSGWHSLIASGTTPKMIENERQIAFIGYGAMLMESFVAIMAMIGASVIHPGVYFRPESRTSLSTFVISCQLRHRPLTLRRDC